MKYLKNEDAVSPVIGVILMVVITVIIAAILAVFAFGIGGPAKAPEAQLRYLATVGSFPNNGTTALNISVTNSGGDSLILANENFSVYNAATGAIILGNTMDKLFTTSTYLAPGVTLTSPLSPASTRGDIIEIHVLDIPTGQMVSNTRVTVQ